MRGAATALWSLLCARAAGGAAPAAAGASAAGAAGGGFLAGAAQRGYCPNPWLADPAAAADAILAALNTSLPADASANVEQLLRSVAPFYQALFRDQLHQPDFTYDAAAAHAAIVAAARRAYAARGAAVPGLTLDHAIATECWSLDCFIALNACLRAGFPFRRRAGPTGQDRYAAAMAPWMRDGCVRVTRIAAALHGALRALAGPASPYRVPRGATLARCLQRADPQPGRWLYADRGFMATVNASACDTTQYGPVEVVYHPIGESGAAFIAGFGASPDEVLVPPGHLFRVEAPPRRGNGSYAVSGCGPLGSTEPRCIPSVADQPAALAELGAAEPTDCARYAWP